MANDNSQQLLNDVLNQQRMELAPDLSEQDYFEVFCASQILKDFDLSYEEITAGIVDGEHDGGVDSIYSFVNGELVFEDFDTSSFRRDVKIELHVIQSKTSGGFSEVPVNKLISVTRQLLKLDANYNELPQYNANVKGVIDNFRVVYRALAARFPDLSIKYYYASKKADPHIHDNLKYKAEELITVARELFPDADVAMEFVGARSLLDMARRRPKVSHSLKVSKSLSSENSYVILSPINEYVNFLKNAAGQIRADLFESNVRDFQGNTEVNAEIVNTLQNERVVDFWWMNNGVTILASKASLNGDIITIENPQIVNGLQTSTQIALHYISTDEVDRRAVMVKIISSDDEETRDKIIKATNSQNAVQPATLRATDKIQRDIEQGLKSGGLFYDRRKNYYKNQGKPAGRIISIPLMAQALMSTVLGRPDNARARPSSLIKDDKVYSEVFSEDHPIALYVNSANIITMVDRVLKGRSELSARDRSNLRFYVLYWLVALRSVKLDPSPVDVAKIDLKSIDDGSIETVIDNVGKIYSDLGGGDQLAKGPELRKTLREELQELLVKPG